MAMSLGEVRSKSKTRRRGVAVGPSIREVCLVGIVNATRSALEGGWSSGGRVTWSGRPYRVEATQAPPASGDEPFRYVHLSALAEG